MSTFTELNRQYFDKQASSYNGDFRNVLETIYNQVQSRRSWISDIWNDTETGKDPEIKVLEYACGTGAVSSALAPFVDKVVGIDVSEEMIKQYNSNAKETGFAGKMAGYVGDLFAESVPAEISGPEFQDFDLVAVSMALHHFDKPEFALKRLGERLKKGGMCLIIDLVPEDKHSPHAMGHAFPEANATIRTHGFTAEHMQKLFESAGLSHKVDYCVIEEPVVFRKEGKEISKTIFIARAQRT
ncbi:class I SAM-dependent DNA methyltransferase [Aspergillus clavatus NRRL 1]|uniref:S-adenosyl-L-methionine-dependent methyltransferase n=1 Tax=Aspergillus clavatus (strain ATCC 1007 / CBS 513.65 / DSM 816 / NCTC 3887 / NRRL 1 / QM 1276 / 107) TaxID=344612 RepID=A1CUB9_ASPCL|nr:uncharacterized protein ACLA_086030 [Aspergillus clavatus NRRL 1]EAW06906.1 conserved hypothetical protein [Aspergillus clavatus NRRL 1]